MGPCLCTRADALVALVLHNAFHKEDGQRVLAVLSQYFHRIPTKPIDGEEYRLAYVVSEGLSAGKLSQEEVIHWLQSEKFDWSDNTTFYRWSAFQAFCMAIYIELDQRGALSHRLKTTLYSHIKNQ